MFVSLSVLLFAVSAPLSAMMPSGSEDARQQGAFPKGSHSFMFREWAGPEIPVWTFVPPGVDQTTAAIVFIMHGARRDADRYRDQWIKAATDGGLILVAPGFSKAQFPKANGYNLGGVLDPNSGKMRDESVWAFSAIEPLFDEVVTRLGGTQKRYSLYGHSAGSQFVHRYLFFKPNARVKRYLAANAGWYTFADQAIDFPFGLGGMPVDETALRQALAKDVVVLLGDADADPSARLLNTSKGAMRQGPHRFARGQAFFSAAQSLANQKGWEFGWSLRVVKGVGHSNGEMAPKVADLID